jgi:hypothetical protein
MLKHIDDFRDPAAAAALVARIREDAGRRPVRIMEVCGTHTVAIARGGIRPLIEGAVAMVSGPGCPVCVTPDGYIDAAIALGGRPGFTLASFGDMPASPGSRPRWSGEGKGRRPGRYCRWTRSRSPPPPRSGVVFPAWVQTTRHRGRRPDGRLWRRTSVPSSL